MNLDLLKKILDENGIEPILMRNKSFDEEDEVHMSDFSLYFQDKQFGFLMEPSELYVLLQDKLLMSTDIFIHLETLLTYSMIQQYMAEAAKS